MTNERLEILAGLMIAAGIALILGAGAGLIALGVGLLAYVYSRPGGPPPPPARPRGPELPGRTI